jgi:multiple sugar transport system ATP-binding protein
MASVSLNRLRKQFKEVRAVDDVTLDIEDGEFVTLLGPSGCGKTTTLNCVAGLEEVTSGEIRFDGVLVNDLTPSERNVAMVFQDYALYPHMSVFDNLSFGLRHQKSPRKEIDQRVRNIAEVLGITPLLDRRPAELSGGQRQRVALGRALVRESVVFLMDEPLSNLDAALRIRTRTEIKALQQRIRTTTLYVTHDQEEAMVLSDRIAVMRDGVLQQFDRPEVVYGDPVNVFVGTFIGSPAMNLLEGTVGLEGGRPILTHGDVHLALDPAIARAGVGALARPRRVNLGIRPEGVRLAREAGPSSLPARVFLVEPVGPVTYVDLRVNSSLIRASVDPALRPRAEDVFHVSIAADKAFLFDAESGQRI